MHKGQHHHNKKKLELIEVNGHFLNRTSLYYWTQIAKECYNRDCICTGCDIVPKLDSKDFECHIKDYVKAYLLLNKYPEDMRYDN